MAKDPPCGAAASYCLKVCGGTIEIDGGTFGSPKTVTATDDLVSSSGAFIMGISADNRGTANISKGTFNVGGQAAFAVYQYATATFDSVSTTNPNDDIYVRGLAAGLTVESTNNSNRNIEVTIRDGEFRGFRNDGGDGVWYGEGTAKLTITGGTFGGNRSGLYFEVAPRGTNVQLSGGTYTGGDPVLHYGYDFILKLYPYYTNGAIGANAERGGEAGGPSSGEAVVYLDNVLASGATASGSGGYGPAGERMVHTDWACYKEITIS